MPRDLTPVEGTADSSVFRAALRREKLAARITLEPAAHAELSMRLEAHLESFILKASAMQPENTLAFCAPTKNEFDAAPLVSRLIQRKSPKNLQASSECIWRAAMPVVIALNTPMIFRAWTPTTPMSRDCYGIPIPAAGEELAPGIVLLPLVAFDDAGYRLGYGGGYFDRTLAAQVPRPLAIGLGFELARVPSIRPQAHDVPLDVIITEAGAMLCHGVAYQSL
ncbi:MAG: 5-formyltetrahydrofolate cyclo-ligase [Rugosibacter sp.]|nr:5-formyltetrahydrofolate cyclo-ligase [Rugosibacter sp.]